MERITDSVFNLAAVPAPISNVPAENKQKAGNVNSAKHAAPMNNTAPVIPAPKLDLL